MKPKIVVVDDEDHLREMLVYVIGPEFEIIQARDGKEGLAALRNHPDAVLLVTDRHMPGMDGVDVVAQAKILKPGIRTILTSSAREPQGHQADQFLHKDIEVISRTIVGLFPLLAS